MLRNVAVRRWSCLSLHVSQVWARLLSCPQAGGTAIVPRRRPRATAARKPGVDICDRHGRASHATASSSSMRASGLKTACAFVPETLLAIHDFVCRRPMHTRHVATAEACAPQFLPLPFACAWPGKRSSVQGGSNVRRAEGRAAAHPPPRRMRCRQKRRAQGRT